MEWVVTRKIKLLPTISTPSQYSRVNAFLKYFNDVVFTFCDPTPIHAPERMRGLHLLDSNPI